MNDFGLANSEGLDKESYEKGIEVKVPKVQKIFSIPNEVQGFARTSKGIVLSASYGLKNSHIYYHEFNWESVTENQRVKYTDIAKDDADKNKLYKDGFPYDGARKTTSAAQYTETSVYVYYIDGSNILNDYSIPSMSEGLCTMDGRVYVLFESGAKKYSTFVRQVLTNVYSFIPRKK